MRRISAGFGLEPAHVLCTMDDKVLTPIVTPVITVYDTVSRRQRGIPPGTYADPVHSDRFSCMWQEKTHGSRSSLRDRPAEYAYGRAADTRFTGNIIGLHRIQYVYVSQRILRFFCKCERINGFQPNLLVVLVRL